MCADERDPGSWEEMLRDIAREVSDSVERTVSQVDVDGIAETIGVDPDRAREWVEMAAGMLRAQAERVSDEMAGRASTPQPTPERAPDHGAPDHGAPDHGA